MVSNALGDPQALVVETLTSSPNRVWLAAEPSAGRAQRELTLADCAAYAAGGAGGRPDGGRAARRVGAPRPAAAGDAAHRLAGGGALAGRRGRGIAILPDFLYRPWTLDADHIEARSLRDAVPSIDVGLVWRRGSRTREVVAEFIEMAREQSGLGPADLKRELYKHPGRCNHEWMAACFEADTRCVADLYARWCASAPSRTPPRSPARAASAPTASRPPAARQGARPAAPVDRAGGRAGRRLRAPAPRRLPHLHPPRPRPHAGQGRRPRRA